MKKSLYTYILFILMGVVCCYSCYDDKGNYTYQDINEIRISGLEGSYTIHVGEPITIKPVIESSISNNETDYTYQWMWVNAFYKEKRYNVLAWSDEKEWEDFIIGLPSGSYVFYYDVLDNKTGVRWPSDTFVIRIVNDIATGFFILSDVDNIGRLDFINYAKDTLDLRLDILTSVGSDVPILEKPLGVACYSDNNSPYSGAYLISGETAYMTAILTEQGMYRLHPSTFLYENRYNMTSSILLENLLPSDFYVKKIMTPHSSMNDFMLMDKHNNLYYAFAMGNVHATANTYTNTLHSDKHRMNISPLVVYPFAIDCAIMYDTDSLSFARQTAYGATESTYFNSNYEKEHEFDGDKLLFKFNKTGKDLVYLHYRSSIAGISGSPIYAILKDPGANNFFLGCFVPSGTQQFYRPLKNLPELSNAKEFAMTYNFSNANYANEFLYYRTDTKIYAHNLNDNSTKIVFETVPGDLISCFKFMMRGNSKWIDRLVICTYNPSLPAESCGKMQIMSTVPAYGNLIQMRHNDKDLIWTGFGKIIDLAWKEK